MDSNSEAIAGATNALLVPLQQIEGVLHGLHQAAEITNQLLERIAESLETLARRS